MPESGSAVKDLGAAVLVVALVMGGLFLYTGTWPPMVVVESGSMMHLGADQPYGLLGTIDPGDMVLVKAVTRAEDVCTRESTERRCAGDEHYGAQGDVVVYFRFNDRAKTPIIHRAIAWVEVTGTSEAETFYAVEGYGSFGATGIYVPELGFDEGRGFTREHGYKPQWSGWLTKGDNPITNADVDQAGGITAQPVRMEWIQDGGGVARAELPWFGLIKLALADNINQINPNWTRVGNAYAPADLWVMLAVALAALVALPFIFERGVRFLRARIDEARERRRSATQQDHDEPMRR